MRETISSGTIDSPSWDLVRIAKLAARIYAPLGTRMTLGDYVRSIRSFLDALKPPESQNEHNENENEVATTSKNDITEQAKLRHDLKVRRRRIPFKIIAKFLDRYIKTNSPDGVSRTTGYDGHCPAIQ